MEKKKSNHKRYRFTYIKATVGTLFLGLLFLKGYTPFEETGENFFHIQVNGQDVGTLGEKERIDELLLQARKNVASGSDELDQLLHDIYVKETNESMTQEEKLRALYVYTRDSFSYRRRPPYEFGVLDFMQTDALNMLTTGYGNCYCYASVFWYLSRWAGYDSRIINGTVGQRRSPHSWVEITFDGTSYIFDTPPEQTASLEIHPLSLQDFFIQMVGHKGGTVK